MTAIHRPPIGLRPLLCALLALIALPLPAAGESHDLADLALEELLDLQLDQMRITGIHHTHEAGEWMVGYEYMGMGMDGNRDGTGRRSRSDLFADGYMVAPTRMYMEMHMLSAMYGVSDRLSLMAMVPYLRKSMDHQRADGVEFKTRTRGLGDIGVNALVSLYRDDHHRLLALAGIRFPTGSIDETDRLPGMMGPSTIQRLPYPMQLGSGTYDFRLGATYLGQVEDWSWGAHASGLIHTGENDNDYRLGDSYTATAWGARKLTSWSSASLRLKWSQWFDIHGADPRLNPMMVPTADPELRAGRRLDMLFGANLFSGKGALDGLVLGLEGGLPVYQWLDGPQLETDWMAGLSLEWTR